MSGKTGSIISGCMIVTMIIGTLNSVYKRHAIPSFRFFFGSGVLWLCLSGLSEFNDEIARTLALAVATFVVIGEGGGVLDHFMGKGAASTTLNTQPPSSKTAFSMSGGGGGHPATAVVTRPNTGITAPGAIGTIPVKPILV